MKIANKKRKGFTLVELLVSVGIFALMTALVVAKYGTFDQSVLLTNLAYDVAVTIRTAQTYGLSVKSVGGTDASFQNAYGVTFSSNTGYSDKFILFADYNKNKMYDTSGPSIVNESISTFNLKRGAVISKACAGSDHDTCSGSSISISFLRPDPSARIYKYGQSYPYAEIELRSTDGNTRTVTVRENGQISVVN